MKLEEIAKDNLVKVAPRVWHPRQQSAQSIDKELSDKEYLIDLADRIMHIAIMHGVSQYDSDRLLSMAAKL